VPTGKQGRKPRSTTSSTTWRSQQQQTQLVSDEPGTSSDTEHKRCYAGSTQQSGGSTLTVLTWNMHG
jgi:hypothetical protein